MRFVLSIFSRFPFGFVGKGVRPGSSAYETAVVDSVVMNAFRNYIPEGSIIIINLEPDMMFRMSVYYYEKL